MNLSRRAKLDREPGSRGGSRKAPVAVTAPEPVPPVAPEPETEPPVPAPAAAAEPPKQPRFVRAATEKRTAASPVPLPPPTNKPAGKVMSRGLAAAPVRATTGAKGPQLARIPIANSKKLSGGRRK